MLLCIENATISRPKEKKKHPKPSCLSLTPPSTAAISAWPRLSPFFRGRRHTYSSRGIWRRPATPKTWPPFKTKTFRYATAGVCIEKLCYASLFTEVRRSTPGTSLVQQDNALVMRPHATANNGAVKTQLG